MLVFATQLAVEYTDNVRFLKIDTDEEHEFCSQMQVSFPLLLMYFYYRFINLFS